MRLAGKRRTQICAMITISNFFLLISSASMAVAQQSTPTYTYNMTFDADGFTNVEILYDSAFPGSGSSWVAIPKNFTGTTVTALEGTISSMSRLTYRTGQARTVHPFYDNLTFSYLSTARAFSMRILFNMTNGAMIVEPNGFFYSPQIAVPATAKVGATLILPDGVEQVNAAAPTPTQIERIGSRYALLFNPDPESRIAVTFKVAWPKHTAHLQDGIVGGDFPTRYTELGTSMVTLYRQAVPLMNELFNNTVKRISVAFFTPLSLPDLSIGGYTPIDPSTFQTGVIHLNLFYFRALPGTMETIAIHELTHQYLAASGISPDLLWVHEGLANYVAVQMGGPLEYDVYSTDADLEAAASELSGKYGIIQDWESGASATSVFLYYAASYKVFKTLGEQYGNLTFYSKFFRDLHQLKDGLRSTNVAVYQLGLASGVNLYSQFAGWGFDLIDLSGIDAQIAKLQREAQFYGPLLPFRGEALRQIEQAQDSKYTSPEVAFGHLRIAAFYIETVPMIIGGVVLVIILILGIAISVIRRRKPHAPPLNRAI